MDELEKICEYVIDNRLMNKGSNIGVCVSGGADSMMLLSFFRKYAEKLGIKYCVLHFNHNLRGQESLRDQKFVKDFCKENNIECYIGSENCKKYCKENKKTLEEGARECRYNFFAENLKRLELSALALAHHKNDQAETIFMHILRGSGLAGAVGMFPKADFKVRPLLCLTKQEILNACEKFNIPYVTDSTNLQSDQTRNYIRNEIFPMLKKVNLEFENNICKFGEKCRRDNDYIEKSITSELIERRKNEVIIPTRIFQYSEAIYSRIIRKAFESLGCFKNIEERHIKLIEKMKYLKNGSTLDMPYNIVAYKDYKDIILSEDKSQKFFENSSYKENGETIICGKRILSYLENAQENFESNKFYLDANKIPPNAVWRTKKEGDYFKKLGSGGKKLCDYFTNKKISQRDRDNIPLLCADSEVILVMGYDISENYKLTKEYKQMVVIEYEK